MCIWISVVTITMPQVLYQTLYIWTTILKLTVHDPPLMVLRFKMFESLEYQVWTTYSYLDRWSIIYQVDSIFIAQYIKTM